MNYLNPWMDEVEIAEISRILRDRFGSKATCLEFGSGGSTVYFSEFAAKWIAVEHDETWADSIRSTLQDGSKVTIELAHPDRPHEGTNPADPGQFATYIDVGRKHRPRQGYDFVLIDGRARIDCMLHLANSNMLHPACVIVLHDFKRYRYLERIDELLVHYNLVSAITGGVEQGLGIFELKAKSEPTLPDTDERPTDHRYSENFRAAMYPLCDGSIAPSPRSEDPVEQKMLEFAAVFYELNCCYDRLRLARLGESDESPEAILEEVEQISQSRHNLEDKYMAEGFYAEPDLEGVLATNLNFNHALAGPQSSGGGSGGPMQMISSSLYFTIPETEEEMEELRRKLEKLRDEGFEIETM